MFPVASAHLRVQRYHRHRRVTVRRPKLRGWDVWRRRENASPDPAAVTRCGRCGRGKKDGQTVCGE